MASGKSTIGRKLARKLGWTFVDTDALVVRAHGRISEIFAKEGEAAFRSYEQAALGDALRSDERSVVALGGGALTVPENLAMLSARAVRVFIKITPEQILARVRRSKEVRPVLGASPTLATIKAIYASRMTAYESADLVVDATRRSDADVIAEITTWLWRRELDGGPVTS
jgi:shikimate kinase